MACIQFENSKKYKHIVFFLAKTCSYIELLYILINLVFRFKIEPYTILIFTSITLAANEFL